MREFYLNNEMLCACLFFGSIFAVVLWYIVATEFSHKKDQRKAYESIAAKIKKCTTNLELNEVNEDINEFWRYYTADESGKVYLELLKEARETQLFLITNKKIKVA